MCHVIKRFAKANYKCVKDYNLSKKLSYFQYLDPNNVYGWAMSQKLPVNNFKWVQDLDRFNATTIMNYNEYCDKIYITEANVEYSKK